MQVVECYFPKWKGKIVGTSDDVGSIVTDDSSESRGEIAPADDGTCVTAGKRKRGGQQKVLTKPLQEPLRDMNHI